MRPRAVTHAPPLLRRYAGALLFCASLLVSSCSIHRPPERGIELLPVPESYTLYDESAPFPERWWQVFESQELNRLVSEAVSENFTLQQAAARLLQAGAVAEQTGALRWPEVTGNAQGSVSVRHTDTGESVSEFDTFAQKVSAAGSLVSGSTIGTTGSAGSASTTVRTAQSRLQALQTLLSEPPDTEFTETTRSFLLGLTTSYEADLWGRLKADHEAARLDFEAARENVYAGMQTVAAQVALTWLDIVSARQSLEVVRAQLESNRTTLELVELRYRKGLATALDVYQQRQAVAQSESAIPTFESQLETLRHELAALLGKPPRADLGLASSAFPDLPALPERGLPADLLANRPDVRAAGLQLCAADWSVTAARAERLPALRLTPSANYSANEWELLFDNWVATLAGSITAPVFDAGRRKAAVERWRAVADERLVAYREAVVQAVKEVEDALVREAKQRDYLSALERQYEAARATHREALSRYRKGLNDYLPVLSALQNAQQLERSLVQARHDLYVFRVQLHLALGGTWMRNSAAPAEAAAWKEHEHDERTGKQST